MKEKWNFLGNYDTDDKLWDQKPKNHGLSELKKWQKKIERGNSNFFNVQAKFFWLNE